MAKRRLVESDVPARRGGLGEPLLLPYLLNESDERLREKLDGYAAALLPANQVEYDYVREMARARWVQERLTHVEDALINISILEQMEQMASEYSRVDESIRTAYAYRATHSVADALRRCVSEQAMASRALVRAQKAFFELRAKTAPPKRGAKSLPPEEDLD